MSKYEKKHGAKIGVKFDRSLVGDASGNVDAFAISGKERQYIKFPGPELGPLIDGDYQVDTVGNYPAVIYYEDDFSTGDLDNLELDGEVLILGRHWNYTADQVPTMTSNTAPSGTASGSSRFSTAYDYWHAMDDNNSSFWSTASTGGAAYPSWLRYDFTSAKTIRKYSVRARGDANNGSPRDWVLQALSGTWQTVDTVEGETAWANGERREFIVDSPISATAYRIYITLNNGRSSTNIAELELMEGSQEYAVSGTMLATPISLTGLPNKLRIKWEDTVPEDTTLAIETGVNESALTPPGTWVGQTKGDLISNIPEGDLTGKYLWIRYALGTSDTAITPSVTEPVWLEEETADPTKILITMQQAKRFNNIEGNLTVAYNNILGDLQGTGGHVQSFEHSFLPVELEPVPNLGPWETMAAAIELNILLTRLYHMVVGDGPFPTEDNRSRKDAALGVEKGRWGEHNNDRIGASITGLSLTLIHVDDIEP